jgi:hypothetical protein
LPALHESLQVSVRCAIADRQCGGHVRYSRSRYPMCVTLASDLAGPV